MASEACIRLNPLAVRHGMNLHLTVEAPPLHLEGDRRALFVMLKNLARSLVTVRLTELSLPHFQQQSAAAAPVAPGHRLPARPSFTPL